MTVVTKAQKGTDIAKKRAITLSLITIVTGLSITSELEIVAETSHIVC